jgi:hypothetical protein
MKVKAKESYKKLSNSKNMCAFLSPSKHQRLMNGETVNITEVPKTLIIHLEDIEKKEDK